MCMSVHAHYNIITMFFFVFTCVCVCVCSNKMQTISECFDEYHKRWRRVENICGFQVCSSPSSPTHQALNTYNHTYLSTGSDSSGSSLSSFSVLDGISLRQQGGSRPGEDAHVSHGLMMHRSSTLPRFRSKSISLSDVDYYPKSRSSSISSTTSSISSAFPRSFKSSSPSYRSQSLDGGADLDLPDSCQVVNSQHMSSQIQHHQLHLSSVNSSSSKRPEVDIAELKQCPRHGGKQLLKSSASVPALLIRKDSYSEAIEDGSSAFVDGELVGGGGVEGGVMFSISGDIPSNKGAVASTSPNTAASAKTQSPNETKSSLKPPGYRTTASNGLEAIKEESLTSSGSSDVSRAGSTSPDKPKSKRTSVSVRGATVKSSSTINHRAISSDV